MKTAKQIAEMTEVDNIAKNIKEYAKQKCKEQREICGERCWNTSGVFMKGHTEKVMINAPEPEFE